MGYKHYYYVSTLYDKRSFDKVVTDFKKMIPVLKHLGVKLANENGSGHAVINSDEIRFNGLEKCGHKERDLGITWPTNNAKGISKIGQKLDEVVSGRWFAGATLSTRTCGGDCSHESFVLSRKLTEVDLNAWDKPDKNGLYFSFTKTAYKPYDLAVNICLIIAKHYFGEKIKVRSDGEIVNWKDGMELCSKCIHDSKKDPDLTIYDDFDLEKELKSGDLRSR